MPVIWWAYCNSCYLSMTAYCSKIDGWRTRRSQRPGDPAPAPQAFPAGAPYTPALHIQACQPMGTTWPCCFAVVIPGRSGARAAVGTLFLVDRSATAYCMGSFLWGRKGLYRWDDTCCEISPGSELGYRPHKKDGDMEWKLEGGGFDGRNLIQLLLTAGTTFPLCWTLSQA